MMGGIGGMVAQGMAFGAGSAAQQIVAAAGWTKALQRAGVPSLWPVTNPALVSPATGQASFRIWGPPASEQEIPQAQSTATNSRGGQVRHPAARAIV